MTKKLIISSVAIGLVATVIPALAIELVAQNLSTPGTNRTLTLPAAADNARVISLGIAVDPVSGKTVEGFAFFHHREGHGGGPGGGGPPGGGGGDNKCFAHIAKGAAWDANEPWVVNTSNNEGFSQNFVFDNLTADIQKWEDAASVDILGDGSTTNSLLVADTVSPDGVNEVYFADVSGDNTIAVTIVWGIFNGPPFARELVEWDQVYDDVTFDWSNDGVSTSTMDFENIATHELGHTVGMDHPEDTCTEETMYAFAAEGETKKRDLNGGDIAGVANLY